MPEVPDVDGADPRESLRHIGTLVLKVLGHDQAALRGAWRDLSAFPDLNRRFVNERLQVGFRQMAAWLTKLAAESKVELRDPKRRRLSS